MNNAMNPEYKTVLRDDYEALRQFLSNCGWGHRVQDPVRFERMLDATDRTVIAVEDGHIIGFARALCDDTSNGYLSMVVVAPEKRGRGIGRELVSRIIGDDDQITWVLRAGRDSMGFWQNLGFTASEIAMEKTRSMSEGAIR